MENKFEIGDSIMIAGEIASKYAVGIVEDIIEDYVVADIYYKYKVRVWWNGAVIVFYANENNLDFANVDDTLTQIQLGLVWQDKRLDELEALLKKENENHEI